MSPGPPRTRAPRRKIDGVLLLDKPTGATSNAVLQRARRLLAAEKAGHTGTLDPLASGLLPLCFGEATKFAAYLLDATKRYRATVRLGETTTTGDAEGETVAREPVRVDRDQFVRALQGFLGTIAQVPPRHAALKLAGRPYYDYARAGIEIPREPRQVTLHSLDLVDWQPPDAVLDVACSKGTYVRVLAEDIGRALGCGGHLRALRRTATGGFTLERAVTLEAFEALTLEEKEALLLPPEVLLGHLPRLSLEPEAARRFAVGGEVAADGSPDGTCAVFGGGLLLGTAEVANGRARPRRVRAQGPAPSRAGPMSS